MCNRTCEEGATMTHDTRTQCSFEPGATRFDDFSLHHTQMATLLSGLQGAKGSGVKVALRVRRNAAPDFPLQLIEDELQLLFVPAVACVQAGTSRVVRKMKIL